MKELTRLIDEVNHVAAGFRNEYKGVLVIDITKWKEHFKEEHFLQLLDYLVSIDQKICLIFIAEEFEEEEMKELEKVLFSYMRIEKIEITIPTEKSLMIYMKRKLEEYGFELDIKAQEMMENLMSELLTLKNFDGYKTVKRLCQDIAFELCSQSIEVDAVITVEKLNKYTTSGVYISKMRDSVKKRPIGFGGDL